MERKREVERTREVGTGMQVLALEAAVVDLKKTKAEGRRLRADHLHLAKPFDHSKLVEQYAPYIKGVYQLSHYIIILFMSSISTLSTTMF